MVAKMLLPGLGGSPSVWNTCMVFFQAALLAGYAYAHAVGDRLSLRRGIVMHGVVLMLPLAILWLGGPAGRAPTSSDSPVLWLLMTLAITVGLPFMVVATGGALLQRWFAATAHTRARDPYFLYAASNAGSLVALLGYPLILERIIGVREQWMTWSIAYIVAAASSVHRTDSRPSRPACLWRRTCDPAPRPQWRPARTSPRASPSACPTCP
jgi:hypothetical protein